MPTDGKTNECPYWWHRGDGVYYQCCAPKDHHDGTHYSWHLQDPQPPHDEWKRLDAD